MKKTTNAFIICSYLSIAASLTANSQDGSLDLTFGTGGKVTTAVGNYDDFATSVAIQSDGKILVAGSSNNSISPDIALVRYKIDGTLDNNFVGDGIAITNFGIGNIAQALSLAIQNDDKILVAGYSIIGIVTYFTLLRYTNYGTLDHTFDSDGIVNTDFGNYGGSGSSVAIQSDGKIVVAGTNENAALNTDFALIRYNNDGSLDSTFDDDGKVTTDFDGHDDNVVSAAIQSDGKIVVAGSSSQCCSYTISDFALARYNIDGSLDSTFDFDGKMTTDFDSLYENASSIIIQSDNKILMVGNGHNLSNTYSEIELVRYNSDGSLDESFGVDGLVTTDFDSLGGGASSIAMQSDGKIVMVGSINSSPNSLFEFAVVRYNNDGSPDESFDSDGLVTTAIGSYYSGASSVAIQSDGKIVVAGTSRNVFDNFTDFGLARYNAETVSITENRAEENTLAVSPNPFSNELIINGTIENEEILIFDELGNEMMRQNTGDAETKINTERLMPGVYFLHYMEGRKMMSSKLVKI